MRERKVVKFRVDMFDDTKLKIIDTKMERDLIHYIWTRLVILAGKVNLEGELYISKNIPYTMETLAIEFNRSIGQIKAALDVLMELEMIELDKDNIYKVKNFAKHQNIRVKEKADLKVKEDIENTAESDGMGKNMELAGKNLTEVKGNTEVREIGKFKDRIDEYKLYGNKVYENKDKEAESKINKGEIEGASESRADGFESIACDKCGDLENMQKDINKSDDNIIIDKIVNNSNSNSSNGNININSNNTNSINSNNINNNNINNNNSINSSNDNSNNNNISSNSNDNSDNNINRNSNSKGNGDGNSLIPLVNSNSNILIPLKNNKNKKVNRKKKKGISFEITDEVDEAQEICSFVNGDGAQALKKGQCIAAEWSF